MKWECSTEKERKRYKCGEFNFDTDVLAVKETGCAGILRMARFGRTAMFGMIVCELDDTEQHDIAA